MTNSNLTDERLSALIRVARDSLELYEMELPVIDDVMLALAELQQRRAAMLQGAESVTTTNKLPTEMTPQMMRAVQLKSELGAYATANLSGAYGLFAEFWEVACSAAGNSPVLPDGWVMVPFEPTAEMISSGITAHFDRSQIQIHDRPAPGPMECAYVAMLSAAPQQEVK
ncbi:hypothetical protein D8W77_01300 [Enterobacter hormaechei]|nr:hypothetical protein [Enterobacter hormaechei]EGQ5313066.1 hypothetical protein [Enterobacter hormaechei]EGQ5323273.1 hypothetical protein [Enterobacter hormaechei]EKT5039865.1 hypothetical protein [Enterobacter hormaechei]EKV8268517.1 hypothetical protein [Enterobacter hormaechei]